MRWPATTTTPQTKPTTPLATTPSPATTATARILIWTATAFVTRTPSRKSLEGPSCVTVSGSVLLENVSTDHSGTEVFYSIINPGEAAASTLSDAEGNYSLDVAPGLLDQVGEVRLPASGAWRLHVEQRHDAEPGDDAARLCPGGARCGTWSSGFVYHVTCDITFLTARL